LHFIYEQKWPSGGQIAALSVAGRFSGPDYSLSSTISNNGSLHACYYQKCSEDLQEKDMHSNIF
jgi:hypothetical protein